MGPDGIAVVFANEQKSRNADVDYLFRADSDFVYLTGFHEPESVLVLAPGSPHGEETLFVRPRDVSAEQWNGRRLGAERVSDSLGIDQGRTLEELVACLPELMEGREVLSTNLPTDSDSESGLAELFCKRFELSSETSLTAVSFTDTLHELRLIKSDLEIDTMQRASDISIQAHKRAMGFCQPGVSEMHLESELRHEFAMNGARHTAYPCIVASGENACILHYIENDATINDGDLVLIDAGCELDCYASDITRTFPANGRFSPEQRDIYDIVLEAQLSTIEKVQVGQPFSDLQANCNQVLAQGLLDLGILQGSLDQVLEEQLAKPYIVHSVSHFLGMDVHDVGKREIDAESRILEPGMVLTVEPGLYFGTMPSMPEYDDKWRGIGIRIEDDVLVAPNGPKNLTEALPKQPQDIEDLVNA